MIREEGHAGEEPEGAFVCGVCGRAFASEEARQRHVHDQGLLY